MIEKVNPNHPDKIADRIAGAIVDLAYKQEQNPKIAVEVLIGHGKCLIIAETSVTFDLKDIETLVYRITKQTPKIEFICVKQDVHLATNQSKEVRCGDNGIFKGMPLTEEQKTLSNVARSIYSKYGTDGKYILNKDTLDILEHTQFENNDFVYLDPPYYNTNANYNKIWNWDKEVKLLKSIDKLPCNWALSNVANPHLIEWANINNYEIYYLDITYSSNGEGKKEHQEVLITNYLKNKQLNLFDIIGE